MSPQHHDPGVKKKARNLIHNPAPLTKAQRRAVRNGERVTRTPVGVPRERENSRG